jgi:hypothetical protein
MYYPKSQITTNLYTNGEELYLASNFSPYKGYYYKLSNGKFFSGKTPQDGPNVELIKGETPVSGPDSGFTQTPEFITPSGELITYPIDFSSTEYPLYKNQFINIPSYSPTIPTQQDYQIGEYRRYFCKKTNEIIYIEINKDTYDKLVNKDPSILYQLYQPFNLPWQLTGDKYQVFITNENITELTSKQQNLPMLSEYLRYEFNKYANNNYV